MSVMNSIALSSCNSAATRVPRTYNTRGLGISKVFHLRIKLVRCPQCFPMRREIERLNVIEILTMGLPWPGSTMTMTTNDRKIVEGCCRRGHCLVAVSRKSSSESDTAQHQVFRWGHA